MPSLLSFLGSNLLSLFVMNERQEEVLICDEGSYVRHCCQVHMCYHSCDLHRDSDLKSMRVVRGAHNNMVVCILVTMAINAKWGINDITII